MPIYNIRKVVCTRQALRKLKVKKTCDSHIFDLEKIRHKTQIC